MSEWWAVVEGGFVATIHEVLLCVVLGSQRLNHLLMDSLSTKIPMNLGFALTVDTWSISWVK